MDYQSLHNKTVVELRKLAKEAGVRIPAGTNKSTLIAMLLEAEQAKAAQRTEARPTAKRGRAAKATDPAGEADATPRAKEEAPTAPRESPSEKENGPAEKAEAKAQPETVAVDKPAAPSDPVQTEGNATQAAPAQPEGQEARPDAAPARVGARPTVQGRGNTPFRAAPRPMGEDRQYPQGRNHAGWSASRPVQQGDARQQRFGTGVAQRPMNPRYNRQGDVRGASQGWEPQRRPVQPAQPTQAQPQEAAPAAEGERQRPEGYYNAEYRTSNPATVEMLTTGECGDGAGVLEIQPDGYGFLRAENCLPGPNDVYISIAQIRRFNLRNGDYVVGKTRAQREGDRYSAMMYITEVNGVSPEQAAERPRFEDLVPIYPDQRLRLEPREGTGDLSLRLIDMLAPIGKGQRGMIVSQPKAGKTTLLKKVANAITEQYPEVHLIVLLIDERPEEVTDMQRSIKGEVIYSTFDEEPEHHTRVSEMVLARAQRLVESGKDVVVLLDSITRLARAYNLTITPTGRSLSGGLDPGALFKPKRFFGAARNIENGGSLTIIATALVETGSRMDDIIFEEFKGTGNMELHLDRKLSNKRIFPSVDIMASSTRRDDLLLRPDTLNRMWVLRRFLSDRTSIEAMEFMQDQMQRTRNNQELLLTMNS